jgi:pyocin large subunit-like protein
MRRFVFVALLILGSLIARKYFPELGSNGNGTRVENGSSSAPQAAPPTRETWGYMASLQDHYNRHGADFNATSPDDYAAKAWAFREQAAAQKLPMKLDGETVRVMDLRSRAFAAFNLNGTTKTYFRPRDSSYWDRQPGTPITTPPWGR